MAFFCTQTGARIVAPGVHESVQPGGMPPFDGSKASVAAETAAIVVLSGCRRHDLECEPSRPAQDEARTAALKAFGEHSSAAPSAKPEPDAPAKGGRHARDKDAEPKPDKH